MSEPKKHPDPKDVIQRSLVKSIYSIGVLLEEYGWRPVTTPPKDGQEVDVIEIGSCGIHPAYVEGKWPNQDYWIIDDGDSWPSRPILWRAKS